MADNPDCIAQEKSNGTAGRKRRSRPGHSVRQPRWRRGRGYKTRGRSRPAPIRDITTRPDAGSRNQPPWRRGGFEPTAGVRPAPIRDNTTRPGTGPRQQLPWRRGGFEPTAGVNLRRSGTTRQDRAPVLDNSCHGGGGGIRTHGRRQPAPIRDNTTRPGTGPRQQLPWRRGWDSNPRQASTCADQEQHAKTGHRSSTTAAMAEGVGFEPTAGVNLRRSGTTRQDRAPVLDNSCHGGGGGIRTHGRRQPAPIRNNTPRPGTGPRNQLPWRRGWDSNPRQASTCADQEQHAKTGHRSSESAAMAEGVGFEPTAGVNLRRSGTTRQDRAPVLGISCHGGGGGIRTHGRRQPAPIRNNTPRPGTGPRNQLPWRRGWDSNPRQASTCADQEQHAKTGHRSSESAAMAEGVGFEPTAGVNLRRSGTTRQDRAPVLGISCHGGGGGIRTHGRRQPAPVFKTGAFDHSATPPRLPGGNFSIP